MGKLKCVKRCGHEFHTSEDQKIVLCPVCDRPVYNLEMIVTTKNIFYIETVLKNLQIYGEEGVFKAIDRNFHNAIQRVRIRKMYMDAIKELKED